VSVPFRLSKINALAALLILAVSTAGFIAWWFMAREEEKRRQRNMQLAMQKGDGA
jgi:putrescine transport system permease protein